jgi:hypothetical protein
MVVVALRRGIAGLLAVLVLAWCGWASGFRVGTRAGQSAWFVSLSVVLVAALAVYLGRSGHRFGWHIEPAPLSWPRPGQGGRGGAGRTLAGTAPWLALAVVVLAWEILGIDTGTHEPHLTISALSLAFRPMRAAIMAVWMGVGVCFAVARARASANPPHRQSRWGPGDASRAASAPGIALGAGRLVREFVPLLALFEGRSRAVGVAFWLGVVVCAAGVDLVARRSAGRIASFGELLCFISRPVAARIFLVVAWTYAGWHLFAH